ncbi:neuromedin-S [Monodelphis domestica]|uniref:neuromedin-S n=1 Tax=Monodelphis domestica TaxID=13616 RepID=UPI0024E1DF91|nr:neuromedin-S [Monodelphis domestica]
MNQLSPQLPLLFFISCSCVLQISCSEFPQPLSHPPEGLDIEQLERLALCLNQWTSLTKQPQVADLVMEFCTRIFQKMQANKANQEVYKRFLFHYSRAPEATFPVKPRDGAGTMGRPFFLFRPRNGRNIENRDHYI